MRTAKEASPARQELDRQVELICAALGAASQRVVMRQIIGTDLWRQKMAELGFGPEVVNLPKPGLFRSQGGQSDRNAALRNAAMMRWHGWMPSVDKERVTLFQALVMRTKWADDPRAKWDSRDEAYSLAGVLPYSTSYD